VDIGRHVSNQPSSQTPSCAVRLRLPLELTGGSFGGDAAKKNKNASA
jgi:hypothetical protein